ncbi:MAG: hypothetical protein AAFU83_04190, partial [Bacteroidota bacterium]
MLTGTIRTHHSSRLAFYHDSKLRVTEAMRNSLSHDGYSEFTKFGGIRKSDAGGLEVYVHWTGFEESEFSWEPLDYLLENARKRPPILRSLEKLVQDKPTFKKILKDRYGLK